MTYSLLIIILLILLALSGLLSASETALFSLSPHRVQLFAQQKNTAKLTVSKLLEQPRSLLVTILMFNVCVNILVQNVVATLFESVGSWWLSVGIPLVLTLLFGEIIPKSLAISHNATLARFVAIPIYYLRLIFTPLRVLLTWLASWISRILFFFMRKEQRITSEELRHALKTSQEFGLLGSEEVKLARGTLDLDQDVVKELLRPRHEMLTYTFSEPLARLTYLFVDEECSKIPVFDEESEEVLGIITQEIFFQHKPKIERPMDLKPILQQPFFIPETMHANILLRQFHERNENIAMVIDEYGALTGLITKEDLLEVVLGQIEDKRDEEIEYSRHDENVIIASGKLEIAELEELFDIELPSPNNMATVGGWLTEQCGDIPKTGTKHRYQDLLFIVLESKEQLVKKIYIKSFRGSSGGSDA